MGKPEAETDRIVIEMDSDLKHKLQVKCAKDKTTMKDAISKLVKGFIRGGSKQ